MERILVALDGSSRSPAVLTAAVALTKRVGGKLILFRAIGLPADMPPDVWKQPEQTLLDILRHGALEYLGDRAKPLEGKVAAMRVGVGSPWQAICNQAHEDDVDLIVIGSHGYGAIDRLLGTTAAKVVNHADRSVLVVRGERLAAAE